jgi:hypothetical protein
MEVKINIKPLSVNDVWNWHRKSGRRIKTKKYRIYEKQVSWLLPDNVKLGKPPYQIEFEFGVSNMACDWDNPIKPTQDIFCKKYGFDDRYIEKGVVIKKKTKKGEEYVKIKLTEFIES